MTDSPVDVLTTIPFSDNLMAMLQAVSPRLRFSVRPARRPEDVPNEDWANAEIIYTDRVVPLPTQTPKLKWLQFHYAGIDFALDAPLLQKNDLMVTTLSGAAAPQMAEFAVMLMLALGHGMKDILANQEKGEWPRDRWERFVPRELRGSTVGIVGYGSIGREIARLLQPWNVTILAVKKDLRHPEDTGYRIEGLGDPNGDLFDRLYPVQALKSVMARSDYVIIVLPLSQETRGLVGAEHLAVMKSTGFLLDLGRGGVVDQAALLTALQERRFAGAALDVFSEEPLPPGSPFWRLLNVIVSPHIGGITGVYRERAASMFAENLRRYLDGKPLLNLFDPKRGY
jgi:phosphoglycerate dehydrogenase-like enzyme